MKLHLPLNLYRALLLALCAVPALLHADNDELITTNDNTENEQITGYTNINGDIQYTDSFIRENNRGWLQIKTLVFRELIDIVFYNNYSTSYGGAGDFRCNEDNALFISNGDISFNENSAGVYGGAIYNKDNSSIAFNNNSDISFNENSADYYGGAIYNDDNSTITFDNNGDISFKENSADSYGGAICNKYNSLITLSSNKNITFEGNSGETIYNYSYSTITFDNNGNISFEGNSGRTIYNYSYSTITFNNNGDISFKENSADSDGGAIYNVDNSLITLSSNKNITFEGNSATHTWSNSRGGAIYNNRDSTITFSNNGIISFEGNSITAGGSGSNGGGAIYNDINSTITFGNNGNIFFKDNSATTTGVNNSSASGGVIYNDRNSTIAFNNNGNISFEGNSVTGNSGIRGGAIYNDSDSTITFGNNSNITFAGNCGKTTGVKISSASGGAISNDSNSTIAFDNNGNISFEGNSVEEGSLADFDFDEYTSYGRGSGAVGGAIYNGTSTITLNNNANITFERNSATGCFAQAGAIYNFNDSTITFDNNANISFIRNRASDFGTTYPLSKDAYSEGGAIYNYSDSTITFCNNSNIAFEENSVTSTGEEGARATGGAISNDRNCTITFDNNVNIAFKGNSATSAGSESITMPDYGDGTVIATSRGSAIGGAISNNASITFSNSGNISFEGNSVTIIGDEISDAEGGAIYNNSGSITFNNNDSITFEGNYATSNAYASGGAIYNILTSTITFSNNSNIIFKGNIAEGNSNVCGGAICNDTGANISLNKNNDISFQSNRVTGTGEGSAQGGAIYNNGTSVSLTGNNDITFQGNSVTGTGEGSAQGGAIYNNGTSVSLTGNKDITFQGNSVTGTGEGSAQGGAIYNDYADFILSNNGNVLFEKNIEKTGNAHRLRSIYSDRGHLILGAADHKKIEFRDSIYSSGTTSFNADYVDKSGNTIKQTGDIIFTGAYTEEHLKEAKGGIAGTADEILASRTSELTGTTTLYGGRLRIEDGAIFKGRSLNVAENANATVLLRQGTLDLGTSYNLTISANSTLSAIGENTINARNVIITEGGALQMALDFAQLDSAAVLTTTGNLNMGNIAFDLTGTEYLVAGDYKLLTRTEGVNYDISGWTLNGVTADKLRWENGTLYYTGGHDWNHGVTDDDDISDLEEILGNLIINGGDVTLEVVVQAIQDAVDAGFGHGKGHIVINRGGIHISGAGDLDGHIIFNGDLKYIRKLFIEKDITNIKIELGGSSAAQNIVDVGGEYTVEIDELSGDGSMSKTGEGEMVIHGKGHKVGGTLDVQEGSLTFSVENGATDNEAETEINELVVGNKEDKNAKVKVDKDTKVKGNKLHLDGKNAVVTNEGTMEFSGEVKVEEGHLDNQGHISKVTMEGGTVSGSGTFDGLEMNGGELIVGNSPGLQLFTDVVELNEGMVIFSLSDASLAATADTHGWDSAAYSTMDLGGNALTLGEDVNFVLEIGGHALESLVAMDGATLTFSLNLIQNIDSGSLTLDEEAFAVLLDNTKIVITADSEGLFDEAMQLAGMDITEMLSNAKYSYEGNNLVFSGTVINDGSLTIPEPATATLSLLALAALAARRRRK